MSETPTTNTDAPLSESESERGLSEVLDTKQAFRKKVWLYLEKRRLVNFPRPAYGRIPNFKGTEEAANQLLQLAEFQSAKTVEVNPDKPLEYSRMLTVENGKVLYVTVPRLQEGLLKKLSFCDEDKPKNIKQSVSRWGIDTLGKSVGFEDQPQIDLFVLGSVAVSRDGRRIGKGKGYADLEFAILKEMKAVNDDTVIVTTVHDSQVFDSFPDDIFEKFDVPVDYILTPTQTIKIEKKLPRPEGLYWNLLSQRKVNLMPILQKIKELHINSGREVILKETDTDVESEERRRPRTRRFSKRRSINSSDKNEENASGSPESARPRQGRFYRRSRVLKDRVTNNENENTLNKPTDSDSKPPSLKRRSKVGRRHARKLQVDFSVLVSNIEKNVRVRQLKNALIDLGIKPHNITWRGYKGFCYLHYAKPAPKKETTEKVDEEKSIGVDDVIEILQSLKLNPESDSNLSVKVMEPTRIETTDVTSV